MAEFKFPKGEDGAKVVAPNGIVYVWDATNGRWGVESSQSQSFDLQTVLDNGAVANKGMVLQTSDPNIDGSSKYDAIEVIPAGARVIVSAENGAGWKPTLELIELTRGNAGSTRKAQFELDDSHLDINVESMEDEIHFRFADNDHLVLNYTQPSELKGKLIVQPGTSGNEVATYSQVAALDGAYVNKSGATMTGPLKIESDTSLGLFVKGNSTDGNSIFYVQDSEGVTKFRIKGDGQIQAGADAASAYMAVKDHDIVTKKYADNVAAETSLGRKFIPTTTWSHVGNSGTSERLYWDNSIIAWHPTDASGMRVMITATELGDGANPVFEKGNATIWGWNPSISEWRMIGCAVHDGEVHVKNDIANTYFYVNVSWKFKPTVRAADWPFVRLKLEGYW